MDTKQCITCKETLPFTAFRNRQKSSDGLDSRCRGCRKAYDKEWYQKNKEKRCRQIREKNKKTFHANREKVVRYLDLHPCVDCGEKDIVVLDFDHRAGEQKVRAIGSMLPKFYSWEKIEKEIQKCDVRCANCHRRRTAKDFGWYKHTRPD
jgi:hypothetical protein